MVGFESVWRRVYEARVYDGESPGKPAVDRRESVERVFAKSEDSRTGNVL